MTLAVRVRETPFFRVGPAYVIEHLDVIHQEYAVQPTIPIRPEDRPHSNSIHAKLRRHASMTFRATRIKETSEGSPRAAPSDGFVYPASSRPATLLARGLLFHFRSFRRHQPA